MASEVSSLKVAVEAPQADIGALVSRIAVERQYGLREINQLKRLTSTILGGAWKLKVFVPGYSDELRQACSEMIRTIDALEAARHERGK